MGYVGNQTTTAFTSMDKQDITGNGGTSYTLSHAVANAQEIEVFVNNVRQEPAVAYTVTGTTLTMTGAVASTDDFYVVYQGKAVQTVVPPDGSVTSAKIADDAVTSAKLDTNIAIAGTLSTVGSVGIGTSSPDAMLHLESANSPRLRLEDTTNTVKLDMFVGDSTSLIGNTTYHHLTFMTNDTERMRVDRQGTIYAGRTSTVDGSVFYRAQLQINDGERGVVTQGAVSGNVFHYVFRNNNGSVGSIVTNGSGTSYNTSSDYRLKENVDYTWDATTRLKQLKPARFNFIADPDIVVDGFIAHELATVIPESVTGTKDEIDADGNPVMQGIDQSKLVPLLCKTILELEARITALEAS